MSCLIDSITLKPWINVNSKGWQQLDKATVIANSDVAFSTLQSDTTGCQWAGPNGFTATTAMIKLINVQPKDTGTYVLTQDNKSISFRLTLTKNTGINNPDDASVVLYPNPSTDGIFNVVNGKNNKISVYNLDGKNVYNSVIISDSQVLDLSSLPKGVYIAKLTSEKAINYRKIILSN